MAVCLDDNILLAYVENTLSAAEWSRAQRHLDGCAACRTLLSEIAKAASLLSGRPVDLGGLAGSSSPFANTEHPASDPSSAADPSRRLRAVSDDTGARDILAKMDGLPTTIGPYRIIRKLGEGGMGVVFEGIHP